jgi:mannose-6-phosphate isomerase-like protein (cupin superfamily)
MLRYAIASGASLSVLIATLGSHSSGTVPTLQARSLIEYDSTVAKPEPGPHDGGGQTTAYSFFTSAPNLRLVFRKRALHRGAAIGYHRQDVDEIYYVLSGTGELTVNGEQSTVGPGTAILTRSGSSHGLRQVGSGDLVVIIAYQQPNNAQQH